MELRTGHSGAGYWLRGGWGNKLGEGQGSKENRVKREGGRRKRGKEEG